MSCYKKTMYVTAMSRANMTVTVPPAEKHHHPAYRTTFERSKNIWGYSTTPLTLHYRTKIFISEDGYWCGTWMGRPRTGPRAIGRPRIIYPECQDTWCFRNTPLSNSPDDSTNLSTRSVYSWTHNEIYIRPDTTFRQDGMTVFCYSPSFFPFLLWTAHSRWRFCWNAMRRLEASWWPARLLVHQGA